MTNVKEFHCLAAQENEASVMKRIKSVLRSSMDFILVYFGTKNSFAVISVRKNTAFQFLRLLHFQMSYYTMSY